MASPLTNTHIRTLQAVSYYVGAAVSKHTHLTPLSYYPLNEDHFPIAQKHVDSSQNDPLQIMSPVTLLITLRTDPKSSPGPRVAMLWHFPVLFFLPCSLSSCQTGLVDQKAPSSRSLSLCFSLIFRKALVLCFASFAPLGILYFPGHNKH